jgi:hypothetical protein
MMRDYPPLETNKTRNQKLSRCNNNMWKRLKTPRRFVRQEFKVRLYTRRFVVYDCRPGVWKLLLMPNFRWRNYDIIAMNNAGMITTKMFLVFDHYVLTIIVQLTFYLTYTVINPRTMMIHTSNTAITDRTVFRTDWTPDLYTNELRS